MKIISRGKPQEITAHRFVCSECGCVFEVENTEYKHMFDIDKLEDHYLVEGCPECGSNVYLIVSPSTLFDLNVQISNGGGTF